MDLNDSDVDDSDSSSDEEFEQQRRRLIAQAAAAFVNATVTGALLCLDVDPLYNKTPYHTSTLTGADWVRELLDGHPQRIRNELGVHKDVFWDLIGSLTDGGKGPSKHVTLEEKLSIFLYISVTGISFWHAGERFQRATDTISK
jgi:hypothetical protein